MGRSSTSTRRWRAALAAIAAIPLVACGGQDTADRVIEANRETSTSRGASSTSSAEGSTSTTTTSSTLPPLRSDERELWVFDLEVGDCFNERLRSEDGTEVQTIVKVPCERDHDNEVYAEDSFPHPPGTTYPGNSFLEEHADEVCFDQFEPFVGESYVVSELEIGTAVPTLESWADGDRDLSCLILDPDGDQLTGSMRGSKR